jgi:alcohol dehydrogenase
LPVEGVIFGPGKVAELPAQVDALGAGRVLVVTGRSLATKTDLVRRLEGLLGTRHVGTYAETKQHVPSRNVVEVADRARETGADLLVAFGGGSPIDCVKLAAFAVAEDVREVAEMRRRADRWNREPPRQPLLPTIAISTTLSAGEFTGGAGMTNEDTGFKGGYNHPSLAPKVVILDPELTRATPRALWAATGIKALDHAVERLYAPNRQPLTNALCREAIRLLFDHLPASLADTEESLPHRGYCQIAGWLSIFGMNNVAVGLSHALGHQIGAGCDVPHGVTSCLVMPHVVRFVGRKWPERLTELLPAFGLAPDTPHAEARIATRLASFIASLDLPVRLRDAGVPREAVERLATATAHEIQGRGLASEQELRELLTAAW